MTTLSETATAGPIPAEAETPAQAKRRKLIAIGATAGAIALLLAGRFVYSLWIYEETDDARTAANSAVLSAKVGGMVTEIDVAENQHVKTGDVLIRIDRRDYENRLEGVQADLGSIQARLRDAEKNYHRMKTLLASDTVSQQQADSAEAAYLELSRKEAALRAQIKQAELDLEYTDIKAPTDGRVGKRAVEKGVVVGPGQPMIAFVQSTESWVVANFKETQLQNMKVGQPVEIQVDAIGGHVFEGKIESFAPGSGATFAVIPPDNATGNFVKIVQRVPVRISLDPESLRGYEDRWVPGLSVIAKVKVH
ncbi:MAG: HlyD family secretion protein [Oligoflexia bacterium]|nr:HlyD family secretion protein [Oligoflexia bacterium]